MSDVLGRLDDEDHGDEEGEVLLREARDVADVGAGVECNLVQFETHYSASSGKRDRFTLNKSYFHTSKTV